MTRRPRSFHSLWIRRVEQCKASCARAGCCGASPVPFSGSQCSSSCTRTQVSTRLVLRVTTKDFTVPLMEYCILIVSWTSLMTGSKRTRVLLPEEQDYHEVYQVGTHSTTPNVLWANNCMAAIIISDNIQFRYRLSKHNSYPVHVLCGQYLWYAASRLKKQEPGQSLNPHCCMISNPWNGIYDLVISALLNKD